MKKNTPLTSFSINRSFIDEVNWEKIENNLSVKTHLLTRDIIFFAHSDSVMKECLRLLDSDNLILKTYDNFNAALRVGIANTADIIVLVDDFTSASNANFTKLIQTRSFHDLHVITWNNSPTKELVLSIKNALASINQIETKELIVEKIISTRSSAIQSEKNEFVTDESMLSERDLRRLLAKELDDNRNLAPEKILAKAIQVIKELSN